MKKVTISNLFLYRNRFVTGYILLGLAFLALVTLLPIFTPNGLSEAEMQSATISHDLSLASLADGNVVDLPYHVLQKYSIKFFGLNSYAIKLPSILIGLALGVILILLLNRWFKNNVALLASILTVLSTPFLYLAGSGTPLIMLVFWPTLLLWLGSKIQGNSKPKASWSFVFAFALLLSIFTPHLIYLAIFIVLFALTHPHLRFTIKSLPKIPLIITGLIIIGGVGGLIYNFFIHPDTALTIFFAQDLSISNFFRNISTGFLPFFSWSGNVESTFLSPLVGLANLALALTGLISTAKGFFASRNSIATYLIIFTVILTGFNPESAILLILPLSILVAHGLRYILEKWYKLFPENPYARIIAILPISIFLGVMIVSGLWHFIFGYQYNPLVANKFTTDLSLIQENIDEDTTLYIPVNSAEYNFYSILNEKGEVKVVNDLGQASTTKVATLGKGTTPKGKVLSRIITSPKSDNSDRIYIYTTDTEKEEK